MLERDRTVERHYRKYADRLIKGLTVRFSKADAEDIVHNAYEYCLRYWDVFNHETVPFRKWFGMIFKARVRNHYKFLERNQVLVSIEDLKDQDLLDEGIDIERFIRVKDALAEATKLPDLHRQVIYMNAGLGFPAREIADMLPVSESNVWKIVQRFREQVA